MELATRKYRRFLYVVPHHVAKIRQLEWGQLEFVQIRESLVVLL
jgi:hypothetical protein